MLALLKYFCKINALYFSSMSSSFRVVFKFISRLDVSLGTKNLTNCWYFLCLVIASLSSIQSLCQKPFYIFLNILRGRDNCRTVLIEKVKRTYRQAYSFTAHSSDCWLRQLSNNDETHTAFWIVSRKQREFMCRIEFKLEIHGTRSLRRGVCISLSSLEDVLPNTLDTCSPQDSDIYPDSIIQHFNIFPRSRWIFYHQPETCELLCATAQFSNC